MNIALKVGFGFYDTNISITMILIYQLSFVAAVVGVMVVQEEMAEEAVDGETAEGAVDGESAVLEETAVEGARSSGRLQQGICW